MTSPAPSIAAAISNRSNEDLSGLDSTRDGASYVRGPSWYAMEVQLLRDHSALCQADKGGTNGLVLAVCAIAQAEEEQELDNEEEKTVFVLQFPDDCCCERSSAMPHPSSFDRFCDMSRSE